MKKAILHSALFAFAAISASAATVNWGSIQDIGLLSSAPNNTTLLPQGNFVRLGYFSISDSLIQSASTVASLNSSWTSYSDALIGDGTFTDGLFSAADDRDPAAVGYNLANLQMYIWVIQATNNTSLANALASATAQAVFYVDKAVNAEWQFPATFNGNPSIDVGQMGTGGTALAASGHLVVGNFRSNNAGVGGVLGAGADGIQVVAPVPEPTSVFLIAAGAAGLMMRRRRQS